MSTKDNNYEDRLGKIKELSKKVSKDYKDSKISSEKFRWLMKHLSEAILQSKSDIVNKEDLIGKLEDIICAVSEEEESNEQ
jgi:hypothetical protein